MRTHPLSFLHSIRWRLPLAQSAVIFLCSGVCVLAAVLFLQTALTDRATNELQGTLHGASGYLQQEQSRLQGAAELIAADPEIGDSLSRRADLFDNLMPYYNDLNVDSLDVIDRSGRVVVGMEDPTTYGYSAMAMTDVQRALTGRVWVGLDRNSARPATASGWAIRASVPLVVHSRIVGVVVVGRQLSSAFAAELGRVLNADVNLIVGTRRTGSTETDHSGLPSVGMGEPPALLQRMSTGRMSIEKVSENGHTVLSGLVPLEDSSGKWIGTIEVVRPLDTLYGVIKALSFLLLAIGVLTAIAGILVAFYVARRFTRRLLALQDVASQAVRKPERGAPLHELHGSLPVRGKDEVAALARSFNSMMVSLNERMAATQELAALEERARLARELHDSVTQALFSMTMHARAVQLRLELEGADPESPMARDLRDLRELTQGALAEMRSLIFELRPGALREEGLVAALRKQGAAMSAREGLAVHVEAPDVRVELKPVVEEHLYRLAQEALHNIVKHAGADGVLVRLELGRETLTLEIVDDGVGFDSAAVPAGHMGLRTMAERAERIGGEIEVRSAAGQGTTVRVTVPWTEAAVAESSRSA